MPVRPPRRGPPGRLPVAGTASTRAPCARICSGFAGTVAPGTYRVQVSPARAQYAAAAVPAVPLLSATTRRGPMRWAGSASITAPRPLNGNVGMRKSSLAETR